MQLNAYLFFNGNCKEAFKFYEEVLGAKIITMVTHADTPVGASENADPNFVMHARFSVDGSVIMGSDAPGEYYAKPQGFSVLIRTETGAEAERLYAALGQGGIPHMPIAESFFADRFGMLEDKFGTRWMVIGGEKAG
jgi:PhnB protein